MIAVDPDVEVLDDMPMSLKRIVREYRILDDDNMSEFEADQEFAPSRPSSTQVLDWRRKILQIVQKIKGTSPKPSLIAADKEVGESIKRDTYESKKPMPWHSNVEARTRQRSP
jgi:methionyl-tRNA formyltransferase